MDDVIDTKNALVNSLLIMGTIQIVQQIELFKRHGLLPSYKRRSLKKIQTSQGAEESIVATVAPSPKRTSRDGSAQQRIVPKDVKSER